MSMTEDVASYKEAEVAAVYNNLKPVETEFLRGDWNGGDLDTGHPGTKALKDMRWAGKKFHSTEEVDPIMIYDSKGDRVRSEEHGRAVVSGHSIHDPDRPLTRNSFEKSNSAMLSQQR